MLPDASSSVRGVRVLPRDPHGVAHLRRARSCRAGSGRLAHRAPRAAASRFSTSTSSSTFACDAPCFTHRAGNRAGRGDVIFLDQDRVEQPDAVIRAAAAAHGVFLRDAQSRDRLARVEDAALRAGDRVDVAARQVAVAESSLQEVERSSLACEQTSARDRRACRAADRLARARRRALTRSRERVDRLAGTLRRTTPCRTARRLRA